MVSTDYETQLSSTQYASRRKELLSLIKQLRATGAEAELDLPRITVIGNQSAGKSSVVEAISGIHVPRDGGTCTRCPIECRLNNSPGKWSCIISIRREYDRNGKILDKVSEKRFGEVIYQKDQVEPALRRAQMAVLNPHLNLDDFVRASDVEMASPRFNSKETFKFSADTICIDLEGPELTDLSFVDLPGLIQNAEPDTVKFVEEMVVNRIKGNSLILVALPMTDDIENQKAVQLARKEDPQGRRTIGVMTKPDMLTSGSTKAKDNWLDIIEGRKHHLAHGYYCTRQPDDLQRSDNITHAEARVCEAEFFSKNAPWSTSTVKDRFGTNHLISSLSKLLVGIINDTLPRIMKEAASKLDSCTRELATLPKAIEEDPATYMLKLLTSFSEGIHRAVYNGLDVNQLVHRNQETFREYKSAIRKTAPNFVPAHSSRDVKSENSSSSLASYEVDEVTESSPIYLNDMREHIRSSVTRELPNNVPFSAKVELITRFQASWEATTEVCFQAVRKHVEKMLRHQIESSFHRYEHLEGHVRVYVDEIIQKHFDTCNRVLQPVLYAEGTPFTQNTHYLADSIAKWSSKYKSKRSGHLERNDLPQGETQTNGIIKAAPPSSNGGSSAFPGSSYPPNTSFNFGASGTTNASFSNTTPAPLTPTANAFNPSLFPSAAPTSQVAPKTSSNAPAKGVDPLAAFRKGGGTGQAPAAPSLFHTPQTSSSTVAKSVDPLAAFRSGAGTPQPPSVTSPFPVAFPSPFSTDTTDGSNDKEEERKGHINNAIAALAALGFHGITEADFGKMIPPDEYETEIQVMAEVRGYFQVTYKRVIDTIPSLIDSLFVRAIADDMQSSLITKFTLGTADAKERCNMYLAENPMIIIRRKELVAQKHRLEEVKHALHSFGLS